MKKLPSPDVLLRAIRAHCFDCCGGSRNLVEACECECALHPYRNVDAIPEECQPVEIIKGQLSMFEEVGKDVRQKG